MREVVFDIEATGLLDETSIDYTSVPYKLKPDYRIHCIVAQDVNTGEKWAFYEGPTLSFDDVKYTRLNISDWKEWVKGCKRLIGHNIIDFDMLALRLALGMDYTIYPDTVDGRECAIEDTLVMSRLLNPDRFGGHGVEPWGKRLGVEKIDYQGGWEEFTPDMLYYCFRDVEVNVLIWEALKREWGDWKWGNAYQLEKAVADIITRQKHVGFYFDKELAEKSYKELCEMMDDIERRVEPLLPPKPITKTNAKAYCPPKSQYKKDGTLSSHMEKWLEKHGGKIGEHYTQEVGTRVTKTLVIPKSVVVFGKEYRLPMCPDTPVVTEEPMKLSDQTEIKRHLISLGWNPNTWKEKDLTLGTNKRKLPEDKYREACLRYVEDTLGTEFEKFRCEHLGVEPEALYERLLSHDRGKPLKVLTSPSFTVDADKNLCPNLEALGEEVSYVKDIVKWLTYRHRRNSIFSPATDENTKKEDTGWLAHPRINIDGRIPTPANTLGTPTARFTHKDVANIPKTESLYGEVMRSLFKPGFGMLQLGYDADGLEGRIEGHYVSRYRGAEQYIEDLLAPKPNDIHQRTADKVAEITGMPFKRRDGKTTRYACLPVENTQVLTKNGWKWFDEIQVGEDILSYNTDTGEIEDDKVLLTHFYEKEEVVKVGNTLHSFESTSDHKWWGWQRRVKGSRKTSTTRYNEWRFFSTGEINQEKNILCAAKYVGGGSEVTPAEAAVVAWILSDGYLSWSKKGEGTSCAGGKRKGVICSIAQASFKFPDAIIKCLDECGISYSVHPIRSGKTEVLSYQLSSPDVRAFWDRVVGERKDKHDIDWCKWVLKLTPEARESFLYNFWLADGDTKNKTFGKGMTYAQNQGSIAEALKMALFLEGYRVTSAPKEPGSKCEDIRALSIPHMTMQEVKKEVVGKKDVFCLTTGNGTFLIRQNGFYSITGNCGYGAQPRKLAQQNGWTIDVAQMVYNAFWQAASPLADLKKDVEKFWNTKGEKKWVIGIDGRKLWTRSKHALVNTLFQSAGVICMKRAMVILDRWLKEEGFHCDVFSEDPTKKECTLQMIAYHDEAQNAVSRSNVKFKTFNSEDEAKAWKAHMEKKTGKKFSDVGHMKDKYYVAYSRIGELAAKSVTAGGEYYKLRVPLTAGYAIGDSWATCH